jgi:3-methyladenine DNA glycosylase Tag
VSDAPCPPAGPRPVDDDGYFEELTRSVFQGGLSWQIVESKWPGFRRAFSNFSVRDVADYLPDDVDRLMSDPEIVRNLRKIEATIENAAEMLLIQIEYGSFERYQEGFGSVDALVEDICRRFKQVGPTSAAAFVDRVSGSAATVA